MSGHTPGPWVFVPEGIEDKWGDTDDMGGFYGPRGEQVCHFGDCTTYYPSNGEPPSEADARLMAAAPELLAFAQAYVNTFPESPVTWRLLEMARAAIAKATGEQP